MNMIDIKNANTIRVLAAEGIEEANSGHPGLPLGAADFAYTLFDKIMKHNPSNPSWADRDRFVLSAGHGSMLQYSLLHLYGYGLEMEDLKNFRQMNSLTPGHPEYGHTVGIEATTGPLGQGIANGVGMAIAETKLAAKFNKEDLKIVDHYTYVLAGDGCMMEGISSEASSLAGTLGLDKLVILYDSNDITIEGSTDLAFTEDVRKRYEAYGFQTLLVEDGSDMVAVEEAILKAKANNEKPSFIEIRTIIGNGCDEKAGTAGAHGAPLGAENIEKMREIFGFSPEKFTVESDVKEYFANRKDELALNEKEWQEKLEAYQVKYPEDYKLYEAFMENKFDLSFFEDLMSYEVNDATRKSSGKVINEIAKHVPNFIGGSADLAPSTKTYMDGLGDYSKDNYNGDNFRFGVREFGMGAVANGIYLHGGYNVFNATFFVFSDYMKPAIRLAALSNIPMTYVFTHDSIGVGEDGPTHQPIEQLAMLRSIPNLNVIRPADSTEVVAAWQSALESKSTPTALVLTRQGMPFIKETSKEALKGGYVLNTIENPDILLMASGSEVNLIKKASEVLLEEGIKAKVISMPSFELFEAQDEAYRSSVLDESAKYRFAVEAGASMGWYKYIAGKGDVLAIDRYGASAPGNEVLSAYGFTVEEVVKRVKALIK
ncbi:MAG TPA: transketolase [Clostridia bacterium]|nr:transketolase [Clostridia bacterium]